MHAPLTKRVSRTQRCTICCIHTCNPHNACASHKTYNQRVMLHNLLHPHTTYTTHALLTKRKSRAQRCTICYNHTQLIQRMRFPQNVNPEHNAARSDTFTHTTHTVHALLTKRKSRTQCCTIKCIHTHNTRNAFAPHKMYIQSTTLHGQLHSHTQPTQCMRSSQNINPERNAAQSVASAHVTHAMHLLLTKHIFRAQRCMISCIHTHNPHNACAPHKM